MTFVLPRDSSSEVPPGAPVRGTRPAAAPKKSPAAESNALAHDTRNWLTVLQMYCDLLRTPGTVASGHRKWIEELSGAVERGQGLVVSLLDSVQEASGEGGVVEVAGKAAAVAAPMALDLAGALGRRMELLQRLAGDQILVELEADVGAGKVAIEESAFERILYNLAGNAIEAMPWGGRLRFTVRAGRGGTRRRDDSRSETVRVCVFDSGPGIARERLSTIFEAGVSSKGQAENSRQGRGFGLAIVRELTELAGGRVRARSRPGRGSCFELQFPVE